MNKQTPFLSSEIVTAVAAQVGVGGVALVAGGPRTGKSSFGAAVLQQLGGGTFVAANQAAARRVGGGATTLVSLGLLALRQNPGTFVGKTFLGQFGYPGPIMLRDDFRVDFDQDLAVQAVFALVRDQAITHAGKTLSKTLVRKILQQFHAAVSLDRPLIATLTGTPKYNKLVAQVVGQYCAHKQTQGWLDFSDVLLLFRGLLIKQPTSIGLPGCLVVDDCQNLTTQALKVIRLLSKKRGLVLLYGPQQRLGFPCTVVDLPGRVKKLFRKKEITQCSLRNICGTTHPIANLLVRVASPLCGGPGQMLVVNSKLADGIKPILTTAASSTDGLRGLVAKIEDLIRTGYQYPDIAIIFRVGSKQKNPALKQLKKMLTKAAIPSLFFNPDRDLALTDVGPKEFSSKSNCILITTPYGLVGQERKCVFVVEVDCHNFPYSPVFASELTDPQIADERAIFIAAISRASERLYLIHHNYLGQTEYLSPFLESSAAGRLVDLRTADPIGVIAPNHLDPIRIKIIGANMVCPPDLE
jgi:hypothetical protein